VLGTTACEFNNTFITLCHVQSSLVREAVMRMSEKSTAPTSFRVSRWYKFEFSKTEFFFTPWNELRAVIAQSV
jgi:hypothetical protein